jgi:hypothetical protein
MFPASELVWRQENILMPYTYKALAAVWVFMLVLFAFSAFELVTGPWILLTAALAFAAPLTLSLWAKPRYSVVSNPVPMVSR